MTRIEYIRQLEFSLNGKLPKKEISEILRDYSEYFEAGKAEGKTEEEISINLGIPSVTAAQILLENEENRSTHTEKRENPAPSADSSFFWDSWPAAIQRFITRFIAWIKAPFSFGTTPGYAADPSPIAASPDAPPPAEAASQPHTDPYTDPYEDPFSDLFTAPIPKAPPPPADAPPQSSKGWRVKEAKASKRPKEAKVAREPNAHAFDASREKRSPLHFFLFLLSLPFLVFAAGASFLLIALLCMGALLLIVSLCFALLFCIGFSLAGFMAVSFIISAHFSVSCVVVLLAGSFFFLTCGVLCCCLIGWLVRWTTRAIRYFLTRKQSKNVTQNADYQAQYVAHQETDHGWPGAGEDEPMPDPFAASQPMNEQTGSDEPNKEVRGDA